MFFERQSEIFSFCSVGGDPIKLCSVRACFCSCNIALHRPSTYDFRLHCTMNIICNHHHHFVSARNAFPSVRSSRHHRNHGWNASGRMMLTGPRPPRAFGSFCDRW